MSVKLPAPDGSLSTTSIAARPALDVLTAPATSRMAFAASHVVAEPLRTSIASPAIDWDATLALRHEIWELGLGVAESMDTAQRGMGLSAGDAMELAARTLQEDPRGGAATVVGINTDALAPGPATLEQITQAYRDQLEFVASRGGTPVIMASRHLAAAARTADDYRRVYSDLLADVSGTVVLHWLGAVFDPALAGYWGDTDPSGAMDTVVALITEHKETISGIKISLLESVYERELRARLPAEVAVFTGDDFNYTDMIAGDDRGYSHALLGAFAALTPWASAALKRLDAGDAAGFREILGPTQPLSRSIFAAPTQYYKVGIVWLAYLTGKQDHPRMLGGMDGGRDLLHLAEVVRLANEMRYFPDPDFTEARLRSFFAAFGLG